MDANAKQGVADACELVRAVRQSCTDLRDVAQALGLSLEPMYAPGPALPPRRFGNALLYQERAPKDWLRAFFTREIALEALSQCKAPRTNRTIEMVSAALRRCESRLDRASALTAEEKSRGHASPASESRLRLELS